MTKMKTSSLLYARIVSPVFVGISLLVASSAFGQFTKGPEPPGWFAGDAHVHRGIGCGRSNEKEMLTPQQLMDMMEVNNLAVISVLADAGNGEIKYADQDLAMIDGKDNAVSTPQRIIHWDAEWHYDPEGVTFERQMIGGHLILLGLKHGGQPCNTCLSHSMGRPMAFRLRSTAARRLSIPSRRRSAQLRF